LRPCSAFGTEPNVLRQGHIQRGAIIVPQNYQDVAGLDYEWAEKAYLNAMKEWERLAALQTPRLHSRSSHYGICWKPAPVISCRPVKSKTACLFSRWGQLLSRFMVVDGHFILEAAHYMG